MTFGTTLIHYKEPREETLLKKYENKAPVLELFGTGFKFTFSTTQTVLKHSAYWGTAKKDAIPV